jgi:hypothetical protein
MSIVLTQPTAYIYNGYRLPELTCFDTYPYVIIYQKSLYSYTAYCSTQALTIGVSSSDSTQYTLIQKGKRCDFNINTKTQTSWKAGAEYETEWAGSLTSSFGTPIWSSHKLTYPNGTVYINKSNEPSALYEGHTEEDDDGIDLYSFTVGLVFGLSDDLSLIENSMFEDDDYVPPAREPVAYLYNGVKLPPLPEWDKEAYPFALIIKGVDEENYWIYASAEKAYYADGGPITYDLPCVRFYYYPELFPEKDYWTSMTLGEENPYRFSSLFYDMIWSNHGILRSDGSAYFAATEPVPVYE